MLGGRSKREVNLTLWNIIQTLNKEEIAGSELEVSVLEERLQAVSVKFHGVRLVF